jgi:hypothetical protein
MRRFIPMAGLVALNGALVFSGCDRPPGFDREAAVNRVIDESGGRLTRQHAECYVDRAVAEVGAIHLEGTAEQTPGVIGRLTSIRVDCIGVNNLGRPAATGTLRPLAPDETSPRNLPTNPGDDANLDLLYQSCGAGNGAACDALFDAAPPGSHYEEFAVSCGNRTRVPRCADTYSNGQPVPSTSPTTVPVTARTP